MRGRAWIIAISIFALCGWLAAALAWNQITILRSEIGVAKENLERATARIADDESAKEAIKTDAAQQIAAAKADETRAAALRLTEEKRLDLEFPSLHALGQGVNPVNNRYVESFDFKGSTLSVKLVNKTQSNVKPDFSIQFLNQYGFLTDSHGESWMLERIGPGETRVMNYTLDHSFGEPVYYTVDVR